MPRCAAAPARTIRLAVAVMISLTFAAGACARDLVVGLLPAENNEEMVKRFEPMRAYLERKLGTRVKVFTATDYAGVIEAMRKKRLDIAWYGPLSYLLAEQEAGAEAFAVGIRAGTQSPTYKSIIVARCGNGIRSIKDLKGRSVAFVDPASTSGGLVPTWLLKKETGALPQDYFGKFTYAGSHDAAELAVKNGTVDAAADSDVTYERMLAKGLISRDTNCIVAESAPLPGPPLAWRGDLPADLKHRISEAVLAAHQETEISAYVNVTRYVSAKPADFNGIRDMVKELGLRKEQMLK
ncbi:MAG: phosphonate ABC transporter substrate-binding protein [Burkholderiales bacterium]